MWWHTSPNDQVELAESLEKRAGCCMQFLLSCVKGAIIPSETAHASVSEQRSHMILHLRILCTDWR